MIKSSILWNHTENYLKVVGRPLEMELEIFIDSQFYQIRRNQFILVFFFYESGVVFTIDDPKLQ